MMDFQLTLPPLLRRAETYFPDKQIVTRLPDKSFHRYTYRDCARRSRQLAVALKNLGLERGDRVATLAWNHYQHMECYLGIPCGGFVLHTLNLRLHPSDLAYIATHAGDKVVVVDRMLLPLLDQFKDDTPIEHVLVVEDSYEELLAGGRSGRVGRPRAGRERRPRPCATRAARRACRRASSTRTARRSSTRSASPRARRWAIRCPRPTRSCRSCRCSTRTRGATRTSRR